LAQQHSVLLSALRAPTDPVMLSDLGPVMPIVVYTGPTRTPDQLQTLQAAPDEDAAPKKKSKSKAAAKSGEAKSASAKSTDEKPAAPKPAAAKPAATKPAAKKSTSGKESQAEPAGGAKAASAGPWNALSSSRLAGTPPPDLRTSASSDAK
jgi:hypothetical protein